MQLCVIKKGQSFSRKLDDKQTRNMLTAAKKDPNVLKQDIEVEVTFPVWQCKSPTINEEMNL